MKMNPYKELLKLILEAWGNDISSMHSAMMCMTKCCGDEGREIVGLLRESWLKSVELRKYVTEALKIADGKEDEVREESRINIRDEDNKIAVYVKPDFQDLINEKHEEIEAAVLPVIENTTEDSMVIAIDAVMSILDCTIYEARCVIKYATLSFMQSKMAGGYNQRIKVIDLGDSVSISIEPTFNESLRRNYPDLAKIACEYIDRKTSDLPTDECLRMIQDIVPCSREEADLVLKFIIASHMDNPDLEFNNPFIV